MPMPPPPYSPLETVYCTDEAIAIRCGSDHVVLTPAANAIAEGVDGVFEPSDRWTLNSASVDFEAQEVEPGAVILLTDGKGGADGKDRIKGSGTVLIVESIVGNAAALRRIGMKPGAGQPPAPATGLSEVEFRVATLRPQIEMASDEINRRFGIDPTRASRSPDWIYDLRELEEATILTVLLRQYTVDARTKDGDFPLKIREIKQALDECLARLQVKWGPRGDDGAPANKFGMRLVRG